MESVRRQQGRDNIVKKKRKKYFNPQQRRETNWQVILITITWVSGFCLEAFWVSVTVRERVKKIMNNTLMSFLVKRVPTKTPTFQSAIWALRCYCSPPSSANLSNNKLFVGGFLFHSLSLSLSLITTKQATLYYYLLIWIMGFGCFRLIMVSGREVLEWIFLFFRRGHWRSVFWL